MNRSKRVVSCPNFTAKSLRKLDNDVDRGYLKHIERLVVFNLLHGVDCMLNAHLDYLVIPLIYRDCLRLWLTEMDIVLCVTGVCGMMWHRNYIYLTTVLIWELDYGVYITSSWVLMKIRSIPTYLKSFLQIISSNFRQLMTILIACLRCGLQQWSVISESEEKLVGSRNIPSPTLIIVILGYIDLVKWVLCCIPLV